MEGDQAVVSVEFQPDELLQQWPGRPPPLHTHTPVLTQPSHPWSTVVRELGLHLVSAAQKGIAVPSTDEQYLLGLWEVVGALAFLCSLRS